MAEQVHYIPVGFDFERLIHPISKGEMDASRVVLVTHDGEPDDDDTEEAARLAGNMAHQLERSFDLLDVEVESVELDVDELYNYERLYPMAYDQLLDELEEGNGVYVNISSMPRTTAFAYATAADSIIAEYQQELEGIRERLHTYYVPPKRYLVLDMIQRLREAKGLLEDMGEDLRVHPEYIKIQKLLDKIDENGVTEGVRDLDEGYIEFPSSPGSNVEDFEEDVLHFLGAEGTFSSTSELAERMAAYLNEEYNESFRSRVQYNVSNLEEKGYVSREKHGNRLETELSKMGEMWVETHHR